MSPLPNLTIATNESALSSNTVAADPLSEEHRSASPDTPPYSPITPVMSSSSLPGINGSQHRQQYQKQNAPSMVDGLQTEPEVQQQQHHRPLLPFSESDNPDAIALRSALSILQIQRQQALRDLKTLERQKQIAVADPEAFAADVFAGRVKSTRSGGGGGLDIGPRPALTPTGESMESRSFLNDNGERPSSSHKSKFSNIPGPQDIIRAPPINWAKYHIIGEPLDKLHEEQKARPTPGQPRRGAGDGEDSRPGPKHVIAAPYSPWTDKLSKRTG